MINQKKENNNNYKHGGKGTRIYSIWKDMRRRCSGDPKKFKYYSAKGIEVCDEWNLFINFRDWSMKNGYNNYLSIDRINSNKGYNPSNCRWVDRIVQNNNTSRNKFYNINNEILTAAQISRKYNINVQTFLSRIHKLKWPIEKAIIKNK